MRLRRFRTLPDTEEQFSPVRDLFLRVRLRAIAMARSPLRATLQLYATLHLLPALVGLIFRFFSGHFQKCLTPLSLANYDPVRRKLATPGRAETLPGLNEIPFL